MNRSPRHIVHRLIVIAGLLIAGQGCVKIDATLKVDRDGSGTLRALYGMPTYIIKQAELTRQLSASIDVASGKTNPVPQNLDIPFMFDKEILKTKFDSMEPSGITLETLNTREQGGWNYVDFTLKFKTLESVFKQSFFKDFGVVLKHMDDKSCKLTVNLPPVGNMGDPSNILTQDNVNSLTLFLNGFRVVARLVFPSEIRNSNSLISDTRRATWEWDFDKDSQALSRIARDKIIVVFDVLDVRIKDFEKPAGDVLSN